MMTRVKRARLLPALALAAAMSLSLSLSACSGVGSDPGVSVDGTSYSVAELQEAAQQLDSVAQQGGGTQQIIADLALLPLLEDIFAGSPAEVTDGQLRELLGGAGLSDPGQATLDATRSRQYQTTLSNPTAFQDPAMADVLARAQAVTQEDLAAVQVEVNPRFGTWDADNGGLSPEVPAWIQTSPADS